MQLRKKCKSPFCKGFAIDQRGYCQECISRYASQRQARRIATAGTVLDESRRADENRPSASARGYTNAWKLYARDYLRRNPTCAICGRPAQCVDHKTMTAWQMIDSYGKFILDDRYYQPLCIACNTRKGRNADRDSDYQYRKAKQEFEDGLEKI